MAKNLHYLYLFRKKLGGCKALCHVVAVYLDSGQQSVEDTDSQCKGLWTEVEQPVHLAEPKYHFMVLG